MVAMAQKETMESNKQKYLMDLDDLEDAIDSNIPSKIKLQHDKGYKDVFPCTCHEVHSLTQKNLPFIHKCSCLEQEYLQEEKCAKALHKKWNIFNASKSRLSSLQNKNVYCWDCYLDEYFCLCIKKTQ
mmetsp:Transcript_3371/g.4726  ORF Transcript_3371/g.4726 Transcript_3371/m.4726 type:complete len:128 (+) Transcript_3371:13-396(+)